MPAKKFPAYFRVVLFCLPLLVSGCSGVVAFLPSITPTRTPVPTSTPPPPTFTAVMPTLPPLPAVTLVFPTATHLPTTTPTLPQPTPTSTLPAPESTSEEPFLFVRIVPSQGSLSDLLAQEVKKAEGLGLTPVIYFDATW